MYNSNPHARFTKTIHEWKYDDSHSVRIPMATIKGDQDGPVFVVMSGMHAGEYAGILAAQRVIQTIDSSELRGTLRVIPVISTEAFMMRHMQLSSVDGREVHYYGPGNPTGSYTEFQIDKLFELVGDSDYLIDLHAGEFAQALYPWVPVPLAGSRETQATSVSLARGFRVPYIELRSDLASIPALCIALAEHGIANIWVECGKNGIPTPEHVAVNYDGVSSALRTVDMLSGEPERPEQKELRGRRYQINAGQSGIWHPAIKEGEVVEEGQYLGKLTDYFGDTLAEYSAPTRSLVLYYWTSPAINYDRQPHGYDWHTGLVSLITLDY